MIIIYYYNDIKNGVEDYGGEMTAYSFPPQPWFKLQPPSHPRGPEDTFCWYPPAPTPSTRLPQLRGAAAPPPLLEALTHPRSVRDSPDVHLDGKPSII